MIKMPCAMVRVSSDHDHDPWFFVFVSLTIKIMICGYWIVLVLLAISLNYCLWTMVHGQCVRVIYFWSVCLCPWFLSSLLYRSSGEVYVFVKYYYMLYRN